MATKSVGRLIVAIGADLRELRKDMQQANKVVGGFTKKVEKAALGATRAFAGLAAAAGVGFISRKVITDTIDFSSAISDLAAITGATGSDLDFLREKAKEFGSTTTLSASEAAEALKLIASAKPDLLESGEALAAVTKEVIALSEASGTDLANAATTVGTSLNQFAADADQAARFVNVLAAGAKFGASEVADTAEAIEKSGVNARQAGVSFEQLNALIQILAQNGIKASDAGTALRNIFIALQSKADDDLNPSIVGIGTALDNLRKKNLSTTESVKLFGQRFSSAASILSDNSAEFDKLTKRLTGTTTAYDQASIRTDNLAGDLDRLSSSVEGLSLNVGENLEPALRDTVSTFDDIVTISGNTIGELNKLNKEFDALQITADLVGQNEGIPEFAKKAGFALAAVGEIIRDVIKLIGLVPTSIVGSFTVAVSQIEKLGAQVARFFGAISESEFDKTINAATTRSNDAIEAFVTGLDDIISGPSLADAFGNALSGLEMKGVEAGEKAGANIATGIASGIENNTDKIDKAALKAAEALRKAERASLLDLTRRLTLEGEASELARVRFENELGAARKFSEAVKFQRVELARQIDVNEELAEQAEAKREQAEQLREDEESAIENLQRQIALFGDLDEVEKAVFETTKGLYKEFSEGAKQAIIANSKILEAQKSAEEATKKAQKEAEDAAKKSADVAKEFGLTFSSAFEDAVVEGEKLSDVLKGLEQDLLRLFARKLITEPLAEGVSGLFSGGGSGGGLGGFFGKLFGFAQGGQFAVPGGGGIDSQLVAFRATPGEMVTVTPPGESAGGGQTIVLNVNGVTDADSFNRSKNQVLSALQNGLAIAGTRNR